MKTNTVRSGSSVAEKQADKTRLSLVIPMVLFFLAIGILLIFLEDAMVTKVTSYVLAVLLIARGGWSVIRYIQATVPKRIAGCDLAFGLAALLGGILLVISPEYIQYILPAVWGLSLIFSGFLKIQYAFDEKSIGISRWWIMLIFAAASLIIGTMTILRARIFGDSNNTIIGIFMIFEAVLDVVTSIILVKGLKNYQSGSMPAHVSVPVPAAPAPVQVPVPAAPAVSPAPAAGKEPAPGEEA